FAMLPGLGWFALTLLLTAWSVFALLVWASTVVGSKARTTFLTIIGVITVGGFFAPVIIGASGLTAKVLSWTPFTAPLGIAGRFFGGQAEWWEGLVAAGIALVLAIILHALASGAYVRSVLRGGGRAGKKVKMSKRAQKVGAASGKTESESAAAKADAEDADAEAADADGQGDNADSETADAESTAASAQDSEDVKDEEDAKSADDSRDEK